MSNQPELDTLLNDYLNACAYQQGSAWEQEENIVKTKQAILDWHNKQTNEAIHGFHGFIMGAYIIRPETDQALNYGRLHKAVDDYIAERNKLKEMYDR